MLWIQRKRYFNSRLRKETNLERGYIFSVLENFNSRLRKETNCEKNQYA